jgi:hypothetical protein
MSQPLIVNPCSVAIATRSVGGSNSTTGDVGLSYLDPIVDYCNGYDMETIAWGTRVAATFDSGGFVGSSVITGADYYASSAIAYSPPAYGATAARTQMSVSVGGSTCPGGYIVIAIDFDAGNTYFGCVSSADQPCFVIELPVPDYGSFGAYPNLAFLVALLGPQNEASLPFIEPDPQTFAQSSNLGRYPTGAGRSTLGPDFNNTQVCGGADGNPFS